MEMKNMKAEMKANWKKIALIGGGVILATIGAVMLKKKTGVNLDIKQFKEVEIKRYHEDLCKQIKEALGDIVYGQRRKTTCFEWVNSRSRPYARF